VNPSAPREAASANIPCWKSATWEKKNANATRSILREDEKIDFIAFDDVARNNETTKLLCAERVLPFRVFVRYSRTRESYTEIFRREVLHFEKGIFPNLKE
jgi:hypothetical protein